MQPDLAHARAAIRAATGVLTPDQIGREFVGRWSIGEILEHLLLGFEANAVGLEKALAAGATLAARPTVFQRLTRMLVVEIGYFPRAAAPGSVQPRGSVGAGEVRDAIDKALVRLDATLERAAERFGTGTPLLRHPYFGGLTVRQWRRFHRRHAAHHMRQVRERMRQVAG